MSLDSQFKKHNRAQRPRNWPVIQLMQSNALHDIYESAGKRAWLAEKEMLGFVAAGHFHFLVNTTRLNVDFWLFISLTWIFITVMTAIWLLQSYDFNTIISAFEWKNISNVSLPKRKTELFCANVIIIPFRIKMKNLTDS